MPDEMVAMTVRIPRQLHDKLRQVAFDTREPINRLVVAAVQVAVDTQVHTYEGNGNEC